MRQLAALALLFPLAAHALAPIRPPADVAHDYYAWALAHPSAALPDAKARNALANQLTPELIQLLASADEAERDYAAHTPKDEKPPMFEGDLLVDNYEGASEVALQDPVIVDVSTVRVEARLAYIDTRFPKAHKNRVVMWTDHVTLHLEGSHWLIADVEFGNSKKTLSGVLKEFVHEHFVWTVPEKK